LTIDWVIHRRANSALTVTTKVLKPIEGDNK
jgi:hypothetical protein